MTHAINSFVNNIVKMISSLSFQMYGTRYILVVVLFWNHSRGVQWLLLPLCLQINPGRLIEPDGILRIEKGWSWVSHMQATCPSTELSLQPVVLDISCIYWTWLFLLYLPLHKIILSVNKKLTTIVFFTMFTWKHFKYLTIDWLKNIIKYNSTF